MAFTGFRHREKSKSHRTLMMIYFMKETHRKLE